jgi:hypothetical protein
MTMRIPKSYQLGAITWVVEQVDPLLNAYGACYAGLAKVQLDKTLSLQIKEQTFCHELVHSILYAMGKPTTDHDEVFVDGFAAFLHQYLKTNK